MPIGEIRPSTTIIYNNGLYTVLSCEHAKIARGPAFCRAKLKNLKNSQTLECTLRDSDNLKRAFIEKIKLQFLYNQDDHYHFLDMQTYEDLTLDRKRIEDKILWLKDNLELVGLFYENNLVDLELPPTLEMKVKETTPGFRGDTVKAGNKPAKLETGLTINVPLFINSGDIIKVDTRTKEYMGRV
jgi:elongation factor P